MSPISPVCLHIPNGCPWGPPACPQCVPMSPHHPCPPWGAHWGDWNLLGDTGNTGGDTEGHWDMLGDTGKDT